MYALSGYHSIRTTAVEYAVGEWAYYVFRITRVRTSEAPRPPGLSRNIYRTPHNATLRRPRVSCTHFSPARRYVAFAGSKRAGSPGGSDAGLLPPASLIRRGGEEQDIQTGEWGPRGNCRGRVGRRKIAVATEKTFREEPSVGGTADLVLVLAHILNF